MSQLKAHEKVIFERLFESKDRGAGYVLNFTDPSFSEFFREHNVNIDNNKYRFNGNSKMKRLRAFWEVEPDALVGKVLEAMLDYACTIEQVSADDREKALEITRRLQGNNSNKSGQPSSENEFLRRDFARIDWVRLNIDMQLQPILEQRIEEIGRALEAQASLAVVFLCGSTLEGLLQDAAAKNPQLFNQANAAPKDSEGRVRYFQDWTLDTLINVAHEVGLLSLDVKKYSHSLKDFRNYIHPRQQAVQKFNPDIHTAKISWQVLQAAIANLSGQRN